MAAWTDEASPAACPGAPAHGDWKARVVAVQFEAAVRLGQEPSLAGRCASTPGRRRLFFSYRKSIPLVDAYPGRIRLL